MDAIIYSSLAAVVLALLVAGWQSTQLALLLAADGWSGKRASAVWGVIFGAIGVVLYLMACWSGWTLFMEMLP